MDRVRDKSYVIIQVDAEKAFDKIHLFIIKSLKNVGIKGNAAQYMIYMRNILPTLC
jgi:hypothetical protein